MESQEQPKSGTATEIDKKVAAVVLQMRSDRKIGRSDFANQVGKKPQQLDRYLLGQQPFPLGVLMS